MDPRLRGDDGHARGTYAQLRIDPNNRRRRFAMRKVDYTIQNDAFIAAKRRVVLTMLSAPASPDGPAHGVTPYIFIDVASDRWSTANVIKILHDTCDRTR
ncbi:hypothetical protein GCM10010872_37720 [Dyella flava]|nr:hypothetical protein GCM10010872_37720 [Dyella flava]